MALTPTYSISKDDRQFQNHNPEPDRSATAVNLEHLDGRTKLTLTCYAHAFRIIQMISSLLAMPGLPRNACTECRTRKCKCIVAGIGLKCERCAKHSLACSYVTPPGSGPSSGYRTASVTSGPRPDPEHSRSSKHDEISTINGNPSPGHSSGFDIGEGTPAEILREGELTYELLLLYFNNFSDIHFMFDRDSFMRQVAIGEVPKVILYGMMALSVKYSNLPIFGKRPQSHRGEPLFHEARKLLKGEFDHASLTTIQAYILLSTYHLTFGGARKAWLYLCTASGMCKVLRLAEDNAESDPLKKEMARRLFATVILMDRMISPSLNVPLNFSLCEAFRQPCDDDEFKRIKFRQPPLTQTFPPANLIDEILKLSKLFAQICLFHRHGGEVETWQDLEHQQKEWPKALHETLVYNPINFESHRIRHNLRQFMYLHLLYHHVSQLIYFPYLRSSGSELTTETDRLRSLDCNFHASRITEIVQYSYMTAGFDIHNVSFGQILTVAAAVHMHACLTASSKEQREQSQNHLLIITDCLSRTREHCRIFDRISAQLDKFLQICGQSSSSRNVFDKNQRLLRQILHYGTAYEYMNHQNSGRLEAPSNASSEAITPPHGSASTPIAPVLSAEYIDWLATNADSVDAFQNCAWLYSDSSLNDLYSLCFTEPIFPANGMF
ncbi:hypothetical protein BP6252_05495 [Coleophoma cylindrospora]|uniref:Zn(2)-C6 fungal-type domain-containing protein n=1 Tax=Coleophoma cylindrospora TaxID=1849047 RepID=A0A3D8RTL6_9HELO|nr:hypothetical protein BP6252_05495 [Coleophoma cylindrospora]